METSIERQLALIQESIAAIDRQTLTDEQKVEHRKALLKLSATCLKGVGETSTNTKHLFDDVEILAYIQTIINNAYNNQQTLLASFPAYKDIQQSKQYKALIRGAIKASWLSRKAFNKKYKRAGLQHQRNNVERSNTLQQLRVNIGLLIVPLQAFKQLESKTIDYSQLSRESNKAYNLVCKELQALKALADERKRIIDCLMDCYDEPLVDLKNKADLLAKIDAFKLKHGVSDEQAGKVFNVSRKTIYNIRKELSASNLSVVDR